MQRLWLRYDDEAVACPACGSPRIEAIDVLPVRRDSRRRGVLFINGCHACGVIFSNPLPTAEEVQQFYGDEGQWNADHSPRQARLEKLRQRATRDRVAVKRPGRLRPSDMLLQSIAEWVPIDAPPASARALDFGCGDGKLLNKLQDRGWETFGIEPSTDVAFLRHQRVDVPPQDSSFDFVVLHHVLEHLMNPLALLTQLAGATREGGFLFVSVPRLDTLPQHGDLRYCINGRTHLMCFSEAALRTLLARAGFEVVARLDAPELDRLLTEGKPLRLRLIARRTSGQPVAPASPLAAARTALDGHARQHLSRGDRLRRLLPVRTRAALLRAARSVNRRRLL